MRRVGRWPGRPLEGTVFLHPIVLAMLPGGVMRLLVVAAIGAGLNAPALGSRLFGEIAEAVLDSSRGWALPAPATDAPQHPPDPRFRA